MYLPGIHQVSGIFFEYFFKIGYSYQVYYVYRVYCVSIDIRNVFDMNMIAKM